MYESTRHEAKNESTRVLDKNNSRDGRQVAEGALGENPGPHRPLEILF